MCAEALANVSKHAHAGPRHGERNNRRATCLALVVADDGLGAADPAGSGLRGIRDRVAALGGTLDVDSPAGGGTTVRAAIPVRPAFAGRIGLVLTLEPRAPRGSVPG